MWWWTALGAVFVAFAIYVQGGWLLTDAHAVGTVVTPVPTYAKIAVRVNEVVFGLYNYLTTGFTYNSYFVNLGGWAERISGWGSPNGREFAEPLIWDFGFYAFASFIGCLLSVKVLRRIKGRRPGLGDGVMWTWYVVFVLVADFVVEFQWVLTGAYAYAGTHDSWTIFDDRYYRFPLYEPLLVGPLFLSWTALIYNAVQHHIDPWPVDLQSRSYMTHGMCGEGTTYPCGGTEIHVGPSGELVVPPGAVSPTVVPLRTR